MAKKIIRLTESDLTRIVKRVIEEQSEDLYDPHAESDINSKIHEPWTKLSAGQSASSEDLSDMLDSLNSLVGEIEGDDRLGEKQKYRLMKSLEMVKGFVESKL